MDSNIIVKSNSTKIITCIVIYVDNQLIEMSKCITASPFSTNFRVFMLITMGV